MADSRAVGCIFCFKILEYDPQQSDHSGFCREEELQRQFLHLLNRHFLENQSQTLQAGSPCDFSAVQNLELVPCRVCSEILESFCDYYRLIKVLELKLAWKLSTLVTVVNDSKRSKFKQKGFRETVEKLHSNGTGENVDTVNLMKEVNAFRDELLTKCDLKLASSYPKVKLSRHRPQAQNISNPNSVSSSSNVDYSQNPDAEMEGPIPISFAPSPSPSPSEVSDEPPLQDPDSDNDNVSRIKEIFQEYGTNPDPDYDPVTSTGKKRKPKLVSKRKKSPSKGGKRGRKRKHPENLKGKAKEKKSKLSRLTEINPFGRGTVRPKLTEEEKPKLTQLRRLHFYHLIRQLDHNYQLQQAGQVQDADTLPLSDLSEDAQVFACTEPNCFESYLSLEDLELHSKLHGEFQCTFCPEMRTYAPDISLHETIHSTNPPKHSEAKLRPTKYYSCAQCTYQTAASSRYVRHHLSQHLGLTTVTADSCGICRHPFSLDLISFSKAVLRQHYKDYHDLHGVDLSSIYYCENDQCSAYFIKAHMLDSHMTFAHYRTDKEVFDTGKRWKCEECSLDFKTRSGRDQHRILKHGVELAFKCPHEGCEKKFISRRHLERHARYHMIWRKRRQRSTTCAKCGFDMKALTAVEARAHRKTHFDERPKPSVTCEECGFTSKTHQSLRIHILTCHRKELWRFVCEVCSKRFATTSSLKNHMVVHTQEKELACELCGFKTGRRASLRLHMRRKHGVILGRPRQPMEKLHTCEFCGLRVAFRHNLEVHVKTKHGVTLEAPVNKHDGHSSLVGGNEIN